MTHSHQATDLIAQLFVQLGLAVTTPELEKCGLVGEAMLHGIKERHVVARALAAPPEIDSAATAQVIAGLRGGEDALKECRIVDFLRAAEALELVLLLEKAQPGILAHLSRKMAPVAGDVAMWQTVLEAGKAAGAEVECMALEDALRRDASRSEQGILLAALIRKAGDGITQELAHEIAAQFVGVGKESLDKTLQRSRVQKGKSKGKSKA